MRLASCLIELDLTKQVNMCSGCGSVGRVVASNSRGPRFESSHRQNFIYMLNICLLSTVCWKDENKEKKGAGNGPFFIKKVNLLLIRQSKAAEFKQVKLEVNLYSDTYPLSSKFSLLSNPYFSFSTS